MTDRGVRFDVGAGALFLWPPDVAKEAWCVAGRWFPDAAAAAQPKSGLVAFYDRGTGIIGRLTFESATKKLTFKLGANIVESAVLTFAANTVVAWSLQFSSAAGMSLTVKQGAGAAASVTAPAFVDPGTTEAAYLWLAAGLVTDLGFGDVPFGDELFGGDAAAQFGLHGALDRLMIFESALSPAEESTLLAGTGLTGIPKPEGRLVWYSAFDVRPVTAGSAYGQGRRYESLNDQGVSRVAYDGLTRGVAVLASAAGSPGLALLHAAATVDFALLVASIALGDDLADQHRQFATENEQETRVR